MQAIRDLVDVLKPTINTFATKITYRVTLHDGLITFYVKSLDVKSGFNITQLKQKLGNIQTLIAGYSPSVTGLTTFTIEVTQENLRTSLMIVNAE